MARTIVHVDMDAFFVSVELLRHPELRGLPVVVGGTGDRGVVAAASYEARRFGIHSAMPSTRARRQCPQAVFLPGDHARYEEVSRDLHELWDSFTPLVEGISLDEAFLDVTGASRLLGGGAAIATQLRQQTTERFGLTCSVGVAPNKLLAKLASEAAKPKVVPSGIDPGHGVVVVAPGDELAFLHPHPVRALWGVGPETAARLERLGVRTVGDLAALPLAGVVAALGRASGHHLHELANARDNRAVVPDQAAKSIGHEQTFAHDHHERATLAVELVRMADAVASRLRQGGLAARTVTLKVRFGSFTTITRSITLAEPADTGPAVARAARALLDQIDPTPGVRLLGVSTSNLVDGGQRQLSLDEVGQPGWDEASKVVDGIRDRFGRAAIGPASLVDQGGLRVVRGGEQQWGPVHPNAAPTAGGDQGS